MLSLSTNNWRMDGIETVLFDKDGTFIDLHYFWGKMTELRATEVIKRYNAQVKTETLCNFLGYDINNCRMLSNGITALYSRSKIIEIFKNDLTGLGINTDTKTLEEIFDYVSTEFYKDMQKYTKPIDDAVRFIKNLRGQGLRLGIVTADSVKSTELTLKHFGWEELFDIVIGRESSNSTKESGIPTIMAMEKLDANPDTTIMVGDSPTDKTSAENAGIKRTILVATGQINSSELKQHSNYVVESLGEIQVH